MSQQALRPVSDTAPSSDRLDSWKEIAAFFKRDIRTLHRWERDEGLPVHRHLHKKRGTVFAFRSELAAWLTTKAERSGGREPARVLLAVLPFADLAGDPDGEYFSDGLTEDLITELGRMRVDHLGVIARTSAMRYKGQRRPLRVVARELGVAYVVDGGVRRSGSRVRVTVQLIRAADQTQVWAESFDREVVDILSLQAELAAAVARKVGVELRGGLQHAVERRHVVPAAFDAFLKGRFHWYKLSPDHLATAEKYFRLALEHDPGYAPAHAGLANVWVMRGDTGLMPPDDARRCAGAAAVRAAALGGELDEVHVALGTFRLGCEWDWAAAEREYLIALSLNPSSADARFFYSDLLMSLGRVGEARAEMTRALQLDPFNFFYHCFEGWHLLYMQRFDDAIAQLERAARIEPGFPAIQLGLWGAHWCARRFREALGAAGRFFELIGDAPTRAALQPCDDEESYRRAMRKAADVLSSRAAGAHVPAVRIARVLVHAGEDERAVDWLEEAFARRESPLVHLQVGWDWQHLRGRARFERLIREMRFPQPATLSISSSSRRPTPESARRSSS